MKYILFILLLLFLPSFGQSFERPEGIVIPVSAIGDVSETRKLILQNTLIESLSSLYRLVPQDKFEEVQEKVFQEMNYEECTEDQCIVMIQEALQVENLFVLQVIGEGSDTQLSLKWVGLDDKKVKTDYCENCSTKELNEKIKGLVSELKRVIPNGSILISENDEEELRKQREEEVSKQREEELSKQREEELRKQREEESIEQRESEVEAIKQNLEKQMRIVAKKKEELDQANEVRIKELESISKLTESEAKEKLIEASAAACLLLSSVHDAV